MISTILLLPHADTRERLLAPGAPVWIGAEPIIDEPAEFGTTVDPATPVIDDSDDSDGSDPRDRIKVSWPSLGVCGSVAAALYLVLARDGAVVPEGVDRLCRVADWLGYAVESMVIDALAGEFAGLRQIVAPLGTLLLLDSSGSEVSP